MRNKLLVAALALGLLSACETVPMTPQEQAAADQRAAMALMIMGMGFSNASQSMVQQRPITCYSYGTVTQCQ